MKASQLRRLEHLEQRHTSRLVKPWIVLMPGQEPPDGWEATHGGIVRVKVYDGRRRTHDQESDDYQSQDQ